MNRKDTSRTKSAEQVVARLVVLLVVKLSLVLMVMLFPVAMLLLIVFNQLPYRWQSQWCSGLVQTACLYDHLSALDPKGKCIRLLHHMDHHLHPPA